MFFYLILYRMDKYFKPIFISSWMTGRNICFFFPERKEIFVLKILNNPKFINLTLLMLFFRKNHIKDPSRPPLFFFLHVLLYPIFLKQERMIFFVILNLKSSICIFFFIFLLNKMIFPRRFRFYLDFLCCRFIDVWFIIDLVLFVILL